MTKKLSFPKSATGVIKIHNRGFGFVTLDTNKNIQDIFIPKHLTKQAVDGDRVNTATPETIINHLE